jgi:hypothetical protein
MTERFGLVGCRGAGAPIIVGGPEESATCDGCDAPLVPAQLVMAVPIGDTGFVHLHADCFMVLNAVRTRRRRIA